MSFDFSFDNEFDSLVIYYSFIDAFYIECLLVLVIVEIAVRFVSFMLEIL